MGIGYYGACRGLAVVSMPVSSQNSDHHATTLLADGFLFDRKELFKKEGIPEGIFAIRASHRQFRRLVLNAYRPKRIIIELK